MKLTKREKLTGAWAIIATIALFVAALWPCPCGCGTWFCHMTKECVATQAHPGTHPCQKMKQ